MENEDQVYLKRVGFMAYTSCVEVGSWLMMATELVPGMAGQIGTPTTLPLDQGVNNPGFVNSGMDTTPLGDDGRGILSPGSPFMQLDIHSPKFVSFLDLIKCSHSMRKDSIDLFPLAHDVVHDGIVDAGGIKVPPPQGNYPESSLTPTQDTFPNSSIFPNMDGLKDSVLAGMELPNPDSMGIHVKREHSELSVSPIDMDLYEDEESVKKKRRLAKNREIAKNCRRRKKERKEAIIEEVRFLPLGGISSPNH